MKTGETAIAEFREQTQADSPYWGLTALSIILHIIGFISLGLDVICFIYLLIPIPAKPSLGIITLMLATKTTALLFGALCTLFGIGGIGGGQIILLFTDMQSRLEHMDNIVNYLAEKIILADGK